MSREDIDELAALYAVDLLEGEELASFERELKSNPEARAALRRYAETADLIAFTAGEQVPPADLEDRIFNSLPDLNAGATDIEEARDKAPESDDGKRLIAFPQWLPWGVAAAFAVASGALWKERSEHLDLLGEQDSLISQLESDGAVKNLRIAVLKSKLENAPNAEAVAVWNAAQQEGRLTVSELPPVPADKDYQLWIIDPNYASPVSAGVFNTDEAGSFEYSFSGSESVSTINAFALSLESKGGNPSPLGPIVLVSN